MPLNVRRISTSVLLVLFSFVFNIQAQTSGDVTRDRISKAKAYIAIRNYTAAVYELENIRRETNDPTVHAVTNVLLMNSYLEQGDYKRAQDFLAECYKSYKSNNPNASAYYHAVAGQVVGGARNRAERYRALGLSVSDRNLPLEAVSDIEKMRETLEIVVTQSKDLGLDKAKADRAMALLEEASTSRSMIARDDYDARRWKDEIGDARERMASSRSVVINAVNEPSVEPAFPQRVSMVAPSTVPTEQDLAAAKPENNNVSKPPTQESPRLSIPSEQQVAVVQRPIPQAVATPNVTPKEDLRNTKENNAAAEPERQRLIAGNNGDNVEKRMQVMNPPIVTSSSQDNAVPVDVQPQTVEAKTGPMEVGSLIVYATKRTSPVYPPTARSMRATGVVKVEVMVDEEGNVEEVQNASGNSLLQGAAKDAVRKWRFRPFVRDGQPVKANGFVSFNFSL
ncbi:MAG: TonB family protein [Pyrinomonadaceae bacterium]